MLGVELETGVRGRVWWEPTRTIDDRAKLGAAATRSICILIVASLPAMIYADPGPWTLEPGAHRSCFRTIWLIRA